MNPPRPVLPRVLQYVTKLRHRAFSSSPASSLTHERPRHLLSISDLSTPELTTLVRNAHFFKKAIKAGTIPASIQNILAGKTVAMTFSKRSTRTRVSTEAAVTTMGGSGLFLGKEDIQLGVNESLKDTSIVLSSMVAAIVARVGPHADVLGLAGHSTVPVINALSDKFHPMQTIADFLTIYENFSSPPPRIRDRPSTESLGLKGLKIAWVGDANNVLFDLAIGAAKLGVDISVATPKGYEMPKSMVEIVHRSSGSGDNLGGKLAETHSPEEAVRDADILVTDTWISMGQEDEKAKRLRDFAGFQITKSLADRGGAKPGWKFMHCLPRHPEEVDDDIFYNAERSLVFPEAENRLWAAIAVLHAFVVNEGIVRSAYIQDKKKGK